jgi:Flp pilus assembly protein CpaB
MEFAERLLASRRGSTVVGIAAAVLAGLLLLVYLNRYRTSVSDANQTISVLVAKSVIHKGTPGDVVGSDQLFQPQEIAKTEVRDGALVDASTLRNKVAVDDIYTGEQLTAADFAPVSADAIGTKLTRDQRAISVPFDRAHGLIGEIHAGDHVDVFAGFNVDSAGAGSKPVLKIIMQKALVLQAPEKAKGGGVSGGQNSNVVIRANYQQAAEIAFAADNGKVWLVLRPEGRAKPTKPGLVTVETLLFGVKPVAAYRNVHRLVGGLR